MENPQGEGALPQRSEAERLYPHPADLAWDLRIYRDAARACRDLDNLPYRVLDALLTFADWSAKVETPTTGTKTEGAGGNCWPSRRQIAQRTGRSVKTIDSPLAELEQAGWIIRIPFLDVRNGKRANDLYLFQLPAAAQDGDYADDLRGPLEWNKRPASHQPAHRGHGFWKGRPWPGRPNSTNTN